MSIKPQTARRFDRSSAVARYWLANCEGFRVRGPLKGTVEQVVGAPDLQSARALVVRSRGRRRKIPVEAVDVVVPATREIVVDAGQVAPARASAREQSRAVVTAAAATTARVTPRAARSLADLLKAVGVLVAIGAVTVARVVVAVVAYTAQGVALGGARLRDDLRARQLAAAERRSQH